VTSSRRTVSVGFVFLLVAIVVAGCGTTLESSPAASDAASPPPSPLGDGMAVTDLSAIGCASDDPADEGELTGAWAGNDDGIYYIRQVGDCVWWFGTEVKDFQRGETDQRGFANVASGRIVGTQVDLEWVDLPLGDLVNGGGLTFIYDRERGELTLAEQRGGGIPFGGTVLTRIDPSASPVASPTAPASP
jgi:hypothetical protein